MKKNDTHNDLALRIVMQKKAEESKHFKLSDDFTDRLMERIKSEKVAPKQKQKSIWLNAFSAVSMMAAALLIGFFITLHLPSSEKIEHTFSYYNIRNLPKSSTLENVYTGRFGQRDKKELSYTQLRRMLYEKK